MEKENPSKVVIIPRPPASSTQDPSSQGSVITTKSAKPTTAPPADPIPPSPEGEKPVTTEEEIDKTKLPEKPITK